MGRRILLISANRYRTPEERFPALISAWSHGGEFATIPGLVYRCGGKIVTFDDIRRSSELARQPRVDFCHFLIGGGPREAMETLQNSFENSQLLREAVIMAVVGMRIYPDAALWGRALGEGQITPETDLLTPTFYLAPSLVEEDLFARLRQFSAHSPNWIIGEPSPIYGRLVERSRSRGVAGPLGSCFPTIQRLWRSASAEANL